MIKKIVAALLAIGLLLTCTACHMVFKDQEKDLAQVVATVNGVEITKGDVIAIYNAYRYSYNLTDENQTTEENLATYQNLVGQIYDALVEYQLVIQYAEEKYGSVELTEEIKESIKTSVSSVTNSVNTTVKNEVAKLLQEDPTVNEEEEVAKRVEKQLIYRGVPTGEYEKRLIVEKTLELFQGYLKESYEPTETSIEDYYQEELESQKKLLEEDLAYYDYFTSYFVNLYMPAGFSYFKKLLIALPDEVQDEIAALRADDKGDEADALRDAELQKIAAEANEVYAKLQNGEDYDALLEAYGDDPGMEEGGFFAETGYRLFEGITSYDEIFVETAYALEKEGDYSAPTASDYGYYIIKYMGDSVEGAVPLAQVRDKVVETLIDNKATALYDEAIETWKRQAVINEYKSKLFD